MAAVAVSLVVGIVVSTHLAGKDQLFDPIVSAQNDSG
jgi:hypothetical protein